MHREDTASEAWLVLLQTYIMKPFYENIYLLLALTFLQNIFVIEIWP